MKIRTDKEKWEYFTKEKIIREKKKWMGKKIILFSVSEATQKAKNIVVENGGQVVAFVDNNLIQQNRLLEGIPVLKVEDIDKSNEENFIIICGGLWYEKEQQLHELGISPKNIMVIKNSCEIFIIKLAKLLKAWFILKKLKKMYGNQILLCPYPGTGDAYLTGRYLQNYLSNNSINNYTILVTGKVFKKVLEMYGYDNIYQITLYECEQLKELLTCFGGERLGIHYMMYWGLRTQNIYHIENYKRISFSELFKKAVFEDDNEAFAELTYCEDKEYIDEIINTKKIIPGKTVILAPYANSFSHELTLEWWEELVSILKKHNYKVFTNSSSEKEPVIKGSEPILLKYEDMYPVLEVAGYFIGVRSGLFDLMGSAKCKKIVIYQEYLSNERMNFFSLNNMQLCDDAVEFKLVNTKDKKRVLLKNIISEIEFK